MANVEQTRKQREREAYVKEEREREERRKEKNAFGHSANMKKNNGAGQIWQ